MFIPILVATTTAVLACGAEALHTRRIAKVRHLAFGPDGHFSALTILAPILRVLFLSALAWALTTLFLIEPKAHRSQVKEVEPNERRHLLLVVDVSPSMRLQDSGENEGLSRTKRASKLVQSLLKRVTDEKLHITMVAVYNGAKPVVQESRDAEVILNFLDGLPLSSVFPVGKTRLFDGLEEAAEIARDWPPNSATLLLVSDGHAITDIGRRIHLHLFHSILFWLPLLLCNAPGPGRGQLDEGPDVGGVGRVIVPLLDGIGILVLLDGRIAKNGIVRVVGAPLGGISSTAAVAAAIAALLLVGLLRQ